MIRSTMDADVIYFQTKVDFLSRHLGLSAREKSVKVGQQ